MAQRAGEPPEVFARNAEMARRERRSRAAIETTALSKDAKALPLLRQGGAARAVRPGSAETDGEKRDSPRRKIRGPRAARLPLVQRELLMGLYNFQKRFVPFIKRGDKTHTIRAKRKHPDKPGDVCHLYQGLRTKKAKLIFRAPCVRAEEIEIAAMNRVVIDGVELTGCEREQLARRDGFNNWLDM